MEPRGRLLSSSTNFVPLPIYKTCPGCGHSKINKIISSKVENPDVYDPVNRWLQLTEKKYFFPYHVCAKCKLLYVKEYYSEEQLSQLYQKLSDNIFSGDHRAHLLTQQGYAQLITKVFVPQNSGLRILEYGPDIGLLSKQLTQRYKPDKYFLIEPNTKLHDDFLVELPNAHIWEDDSQIIEIEDDSLDLIVMVHVFDHILHPYEKLRLLREKLRHGGKLFLVTHSSGSLLRYVLRKNWPPYCLHHPQLYCPASIQNILIRAGFSGVETHRTYNYFKLGTYLNGILSIINVDKTFSFGPVVKMPVGNIATMATK